MRFILKVCINRTMHAYSFFAFICLNCQQHCIWNIATCFHISHMLLMIQVTTLQLTFLFRWLLSAGFNEVEDERVEADIMLVNVFSLKHHRWDERPLTPLEAYRCVACITSVPFTISCRHSKKHRRLLAVAWGRQALWSSLLTLFLKTSDYTSTGVFSDVPIIVNAD
jgi:hypothetical protein